MISAYPNPVEPGVPDKRHRLMLSRLTAALAQVVVIASGTVGYVAAQSQPDQTTIQDVITRANSEQVQALAAANPSLMADTATADYLQELTQINQGLSSNGVTSIALVNVEWGPI